MSPFGLCALSNATSHLGRFGRPGVAGQGAPNGKLKQGRGFPDENARSSSPMLGFCPWPWGIAPRSANGQTPAVLLPRFFFATFLTGFLAWAFFLAVLVAVGFCGVAAEPVPATPAKNRAAISETTIFFSMEQGLAVGAGHIAPGGIVAGLPAQFS